jgi:hypothetical protein
MHVVLRSPDGQIADHPMQAATLRSPDAGDLRSPDAGDLEIARCR